jgi:multimeric flavodoxin WrbA
MDVSLNIMKREGVGVEVLRPVDFDLPVGVQPNMEEHGTDKDDWPQLYKKIKDADILVLGTPIWLGERSSIASKVIVRLCAMSGDHNDKDQGGYLSYGN